MNLDKLSSDALESALQTLVRDDRRLTARILAHLAEVDARKLYLDRACSRLLIDARLLHPRAALR